jgi:hypothetical protein
MNRKFILFPGNQMNCHHVGTAIITGILAITLCIWSISAHAVTVSGLYEAEIPVTDQLIGSRKTAIRAALRIVLVKLTGDRNAPERAALEPVMAQAERYALQFRYRDDLSRPAQQAMKLWVQFDEDALNKIMRDYGIPLWGKERPSTLVWLASDGSTGRRLVNIEDSSDYLGMLDKRAQLRGISLIFPLFDLEDSSHLKASDIWGGFSEPVTSASARYHADTILTGSIEQVIPSVWEARWTVYIDDQVTNWVTQGDLPDVVLDEGIDGLIDILASRFASSGGYAQSNIVDISVSDIFNLDQYARTLKYLESLNSVTEVNVIRVESGKVTFQVRVHGGEMMIAQAITLGNTLEPVTTEKEYSYRLVAK